MSFFNRKFGGRKLRKKSQEEPLFTSSLVPAVPHTIFVYTDNNTALCWDLFHAKELIFKKRR